MSNSIYKWPALKALDDPIFTPQVNFIIRIGAVAIYSILIFVMIRDWLYPLRPAELGKYNADDRIANFPGDQIPAHIPPKNRIKDLVDLFKARFFGAKS